MTTETRLEIEVKLKIGDAGAFRQTLLQKGFRSTAPRAFESNIVFDTPGKKLKKRKKLLRLRRINDRCILTFKQPAGSSGGSVLKASEARYKIREEIETEIPDFETMEKIILGLGYVPAFIYEKYREEFEADDVHLMLDETPIGNFIEIEGAAAAIDRAALLLGFGTDDYITANYRKLFKRTGGTGHMVFR